LDPNKDFISCLLTEKINGQMISDETIIGILNLFLTAGHDSTTSSLGVLFNYIANNPDAQGQLRNDPGLLPTAIEEILRFESPVQLMPRKVTKDTVLHGQQLKAGDSVFLYFGSGNRDETTFENANQVILNRKPNKYLIFGHGLHKCIGSPIALLELRIALEELLSRTLAIVPDGEPVRTDFQRFGVSNLPVLLLS